MASQSEDMQRRKEQTVKYVKESVIGVDENDRMMWKLLTDVPLMKTPFQYIAFILNVILPGTGIMMASSFCEKWSKSLFFLGLFCLLLSPFLIGWIPSIYWGLLIVRKTWEDPEEVNKFMKATDMKNIR